jgi:hypothetical protein
MKMEVIIHMKSHLRIKNKVIMEKVNVFGKTIVGGIFILVTCSICLIINKL